MSLEGVVDWVLSRVEVVDVNEVDKHACEKVATVGEHDFTALLNWQVLILLDLVRKHVHHPDSIKESHYNLEASWVESHALCAFTELLVDLELESKRRAITPNFDCPVRRACGDQILLDAHIHA